MSRAWRATIATVLLCTLSLPATADDWGPWETETPKQRSAVRSGSPLGSAIRLFQKHISPVDGARCRMYPTCSAYALAAVEEHGPWLGTFIFVDRLYRENDPAERQRTVVKHGYIRYDDPPRANTFWLTPRP